MEKTDYGGFDTDKWASRVDEEQRRNAYEHLTASTAAKQKEIERNYGVKYSLLFELPYYDTVRFLALDPMHLLFLGIAKHTLKTWTTLGIINDSHFNIIQERVNKLFIPSTLGRIPLKLSSGFAQLTADQWKNWICIFSPYSLYGILPLEHWYCWWLFIQACHMICKKRVSLSECKQGQAFIVEFCKSFENLYGKENLVINMHLACHLHECMMDYGPLHAFWCFGFERFNGILGSYPNNHQNISVTIMKKFEDYLQANAHDVQVEFQPILSEISDTDKSVTGSLCDIQEHSELLKPFREYILPSEYKEHLSQVYKAMHTNVSVVASFCIRSAKMSFMGHILSSTLARSKNGTCVAAHVHRPGESTNRPHMGIVKFYFQHNIEVDSAQVSKVMAVVDWFRIHPDRDLLQPPLEIWEEKFMPLGPLSFLPVDKILFPVAFAHDKFHTSLGHESVIVTMPIVHVS